MMLVNNNILIYDTFIKLEPGSFNFKGFLEVSAKKACLRFGLVMKQTNACKAHHHTILITGFNDVIITDRAA